MGAIIKIIFWIILVWFALAIVVKIIEKIWENRYLRKIGSWIGDVKNTSPNMLVEQYKKLSADIEKYPHQKKLHFFRAMVSAKLSTLSNENDVIQFFYHLSSDDLKMWQNHSPTPAMDTQFISNLRRQSGKNKSLMDIHDVIGEIGNSKNFDNTISEFITAKYLRENGIFK